jgi:predicted hotdog family 3-hydroxylacyl-ACP dehydratase
MNAMIEVPSDGAYFEGHFPGRPILAGVTELMLVLDAVASEARRPVSIQGIAFARLRQLVFPGDRLELVARGQEAARLRFDLRRAGVLVANGEFNLGPPQAPHSATTPCAAPGSHAAATPPLDKLLPHRPPMRFLTSILQQTADGLICAARIPGKCALVCNGSAPAVTSIEAAAQAAAAWEALRRSRSTGVASPRIGYLVAMREVEFFTERIAADRDLLVSVSLEAASPPLTHYRVEISLEGMLVTRGTIATFLAGNRE